MKALKITGIVLAVLIVVYFSLGIITPSYSYSSQVIIERPIAHTWKVFTDPDNTGKWLEGFKSIETIEGEPMTVGSKFRIVFLQDGEEFEMLETMTAIDENERFAFDLETEVHTGSVDIRFSELDSMQTEITAVTVSEGKNLFMKSMFVLMKGYFQSMSDQQYAKLKEVIEATEMTEELEAEENLESTEASEE